MNSGINSTIKHCGGEEKMPLTSILSLLTMSFKSSINQGFQKPGQRGQGLFKFCFDEFNKTTIMVLYRSPRQYRLTKKINTKQTTEIYFFYFKGR